MHARSTHRARDNDINFCSRSDPPQTILARNHFGNRNLERAAPSSEFFDTPGITNRGHGWTKYRALLGQQARSRISAKREDLKSIR
jgi:hypothetical protein